MIEDHSIYTPKNAVNTWTDMTVTVQWLLLCSTNNKGEEKDFAILHRNPTLHTHTIFSFPGPLI